MTDRIGLSGPIRLPLHNRKPHEATMLDPKCYEIAEHFLPDDANEARKNELAQGIQDYIELMLFEPDAKLTPAAVQQIRAAMAEFLNT